MDRPDFRFHRIAFSMVICCTICIGVASAAFGQQRHESGPERHWVSASSGVVASVQPVATRAGIAAFEQGGNAVDAAIATALTLGVVDNHNSGIGGGCFILIHRADGSLIAIDGREAAPAAATRDMFLVAGQADTELSQLGPLASGVPGALAAYDMAIRECGES